MGDTTIVRSRKQTICVPVQDRWEYQGHEWAVTPVVYGPDDFSDDSWTATHVDTGLRVPVVIEDTPVKAKLAAEDQIDTYRDKELERAINRSPAAITTKTCPRCGGSGEISINTTTRGDSHE